MSELKLNQTEFSLENGETDKMVYNEDDDIMDIFFGENETATGIELTDHILLRLNRKTGKAVSLMIRHFSLLTEQTEYGPRSYALKHLAELPDELKQMVVRLMTKSPINLFLKISNFQAVSAPSVPLTYVEPCRPGPALGQTQTWQTSGVA